MLDGVRTHCSNCSSSTACLWLQSAARHVCVSHYQCVLRHSISPPTQWVCIVHDDVWGCGNRPLGTLYDLLVVSYVKHFHGRRYTVCIVLLLPLRINQLAYSLVNRTTVYVYVNLECSCTCTLRCVRSCTVHTHTYTHTWTHTHLNTHTHTHTHTGEALGAGPLPPDW